MKLIDETFYTQRYNVTAGDNSDIAVLEKKDLIIYTYIYAKKLIRPWQNKTSSDIMVTSICLVYHVWEMRLRMNHY